ncbi:IS66 family transposase zinc-finger binding domain-containing protein [Pseudofrankia sp. BMG5.36]|uniref:IS66 family transposase zinc-finger binding domain-containing protein n=1 Tax=Pseudofrankia sp. BMG5.36 TaxID=1834512 RepID=UPI0008D9AF2E|nr:IS66 family transposase zinc-finger binding domain-containing protein [Pseudofrankia sp. BMG5.36]OHV47382.1 hypothetical protein BCD48_18645 [Pseudofrankia sp. BMG5.36]
MTRTVSDGLAKPEPRSLRRKTGRRPGGQDGHDGSTLKLVDDGARTVVHEPAVCGGCGDPLLGAPVTQVERRQVVDLPPLAPQVVEHRLVERECACCGTRTRAVAPVGVASRSSTGRGSRRWFSNSTAASS